MKNLCAAGLLSTLLFTVFPSFSQVEPQINQQIPDKPFLFSSLPDKFECNLAELEKLFSISPPQKFNLKLNNAFRLDGVLAEKFIRSDRLTSLNIRLDNYASALFTISRTIEKDITTYTGRIVSIKHGDLLLLRKENGKYYFIKQELKLVMVE